MILLLLSALVTCIAALSLGQAALRICGASSWSWTAPPVGIAALMLLALPARYVPGRAETTAVVIAVLTVASFVWCVRARGHRPPLFELGAAAPVVLLALVPFAAAGRAGTLGVSLDNDMSEHLPYVAALMSKAVENISPLQASYPLGPHSVVAAISAGLGIRADLAFAGFTFALPVLSAWTALHALRRPTRLGPSLLATVVGMPYLFAAYYGEGSFKELLLAQLVLALALWLDRPVPAAGRWMCAPLALLVAGTAAVYSGPGLLWPAAFLGLWLVGRTASRIRQAGVRTLATELRAQVVWVVIGLGVLLVVLIPELPLLENSFELFHDRASLGNLAHPLSFREAFGVWSNPDFRFGAHPAFAWWTGFVAVLVILGVAWSIRQGRWMLPAAAGASSLIWAYSTHFESPYLSAKALVILSPALLVLAALPLAERPQRSFSGWWAISSLLALVLWARVADSDLQALRISPVGPTAHLVELRALRGELHGEPTLFLGNDDFIAWDLAGVPIAAPVISGPTMALSPEKPWSYGMALDIDSVTTSTINSVDWLITTRDAAQSTLPPQFQLVRSTADFELWRRTGVVSPRHTLGEGQGPGAIFDCSTPAGRALVRAGGEAEVRAAPVTVPVGGMGPGATIVVRLDLEPGAWDLGTPYQSPLPVTVDGPGGVLLRRLPANLDRPGPRWPIGRIVVPPSGSVSLTLHATGTLLTPAQDVAYMVSIVATPVGTAHVVPLRAACGRYVDWYTSPA